METVQAIALMLGASWASGINLYAAILALGWLGSTGQADLPPQLEVLTDPMVMTAAGFMYCVEFFADKTPGVDTAWDTLHTFIRIPAGAIMAAAVAEGMEVGQAAELAALILGGSLAATSHATKAGTRVLINTSPEASITEDVAVVAAMWAALNHPILFLVALGAFIALVIWLLPKLWRALKRIAHAIGHWFRPSPTERPPTEEGTSFRSKRQALLQDLYGNARKGRR
jgi:hypothetical protein